MAERGNFAQVAEDRIGLGVRPVRELSDFVKNVPSRDEKILQAIVVEIGHTVGPAGHFQGRPGQAAPACDINKDTVADYERGRRSPVRWSSARCLAARHCPNRETDPDLEKIVTALHDRFKVEYLAPGPCTGEPAFTALKKAFGDHYLGAHQLRGVSSAIRK